MRPTSGTSATELHQLCGRRGIWSARRCTGDDQTMKVEASTPAPRLIDGPGAAPATVLLAGGALRVSVHGPAANPGAPPGARPDAGPAGGVLIQPCTTTTKGSEQGHLPHDRGLSLARSSHDRDDPPYRAGGDRWENVVPKFSCYREYTQAVILGTSVVVPPRSPYSASGWKYLL